MWDITADVLLFQGGIGLITALGMKALKLQTITDEVGR
jgi:hypothetical protein